MQAEQAVALVMFLVVFAVLCIVVRIIDRVLKWLLRGLFKKPKRVQQVQQPRQSQTLPSIRPRPGEAIILTETVVIDGEVEYARQRMWW